MGTFRLLLAASVMLAHFAPYSQYMPSMVAPDIAVEGFYEVSGFLITLVLFEKYQSKSLFYGNRALRIYPIYWVAVAIYLLAEWTVSGTSFFQNYLGDAKILDWPMALLIGFSNIFLFGIDILQFISGDNQGTIEFFRVLPNYFFSRFVFIPVAWTLALELMFYVIAPFIVRRLSLTIGVVILSLAARYIAYRHGFSGDVYNYKTFPFELFYFLLGSLSYRGYRLLRDASPQFRTVVSLASGVFLLILTARYSELPDTPLMHTLSPNKWFLYVSRHAYLLAIPLLLPGTVWLTRHSRIDTFVGSLSYPLYLMHPLFLALVITQPYVLSIPTPVFIVATSLLLSVLMTLLVERPIDRMRESRVKQKSRPAAVLVHSM
jgi:peptidoglycan/LPS O-acetylase OafA/YrhL